MTFTNSQQDVISYVWFEPQPKVSFLDKVSVVRSLDSITWSTILQSLVTARLCYRLTSGRIVQLYSLILCLKWRIPLLRGAETDHKKQFQGGNKSG